MQNKIDTAMVLAAGLGTRMRPVSGDKPKPLVTLAGRPFSNNLVWNQAILAGRAFGVRMEGLWMHVGSPDEFKAAEAAIAPKRGTS